RLEHRRVGGGGAGLRPLAGGGVVAGQGGEETVVVVGVGAAVVGGGVDRRDRVGGALPRRGQVRERRGQRVAGSDRRSDLDRVDGGGRVVEPGAAVRRVEPVVGDGAAHGGDGGGDGVGGTRPERGRRGRGTAAVARPVVVAGAGPGGDPDVGGDSADGAAGRGLHQGRRGRLGERETLRAEQLAVVADQHLVEDIESRDGVRVGVALREVEGVLGDQARQPGRLVGGLEILLLENRFVRGVVEAHGRVRLAVGQVHDRPPHRERV